MTWEEALEDLRRAAPLLTVDHGKAGSSYFARLFDHHPEVLSLPHVAYLYGGLLHAAARRRTLPGKEAYEYVTAESNVAQLVNEPTLKTRAQFLRMGDDPDAGIDRGLLRQILQTLLRDREAVSPPDVIRSVYLGYALAAGRPVHSVKYLLLNESVTSRDGTLFDAVERDFPQAKVVHLVRDPRANFASLRHQYVNQWRSMYPLERFARGENGCTWLWILRTTVQGAETIRFWKAKTDPRKFFTVRIEDLNLRFVPTLERITRWLEVSWYPPWSSPEYVPTSGGRPWRGISSYSTAYQPFTDGPLSNDPESSDRAPGLDRGIAERWKKRLTRRETAFLEALYEGELREHDYPFLVLGRNPSRRRVLWNLLFPFAGEIPPLRWYSRAASIPDLFRKISYPLLLPFAYVFSRITFVFLYVKGEFR